MPIIKLCSKQYNTMQDVACLLEYVMNPDKRINNIFGYENLYVHNNVVNVAKQFEDINIYYGKTSGNLVKHLIISYDYLEGQSSPRSMEMVLRNLLHSTLCGFPYIYAMHENTLHPHFHIVFCSTNLYTGKKYVDNQESIFDIAQTLSHYSTYIGEDGHKHHMDYKVVYG